MIAITGPGSFEWILLAAGGVLSLALLVFFIFVFTRKEQR
jgi:LPXTG-motif cell wall-anchored protein